MNGLQRKNDSKKVEEVPIIQKEFHNSPSAISIISFAGSANRVNPNTVIENEDAQNFEQSEGNTDKETKKIK